MINDPRVKGMKISNDKRPTCKWNENQQCIAKHNKYHTDRIIGKSNREIVETETQ